MKKLFLLLFIPLFLDAQEYLPILQENKVWKYSFSGNPQCSDYRGFIELDYSLGAEAVINGKTYKTLFQQYYFDSYAHFLYHKNCDIEHDAEHYLYHLNASNYNRKNHVGYVREDIENKKVFIIKHPTNTHEFVLFNFQPSNYTLREINPVQVYNINSSQYKFDTHYDLTPTYTIYTGIGDGEDFLTPTFGHIDPPYIFLIAFSTDFGQTFYNYLNQNLSINDVENSSEYYLKSNIATHWLELNTTERIKSIKILNQMGQPLLFKIKNYNPINIQNLPLGKYYLIIETDHNTSKLKFIKK